MSFDSLRGFHTPLNEAIVEIRKRRNDQELMSKVERHFGQMLPTHFTQTEPIFYLSRYVATPNYEALRFLKLGYHYDFKTVISQDGKNKFVTNNELKKSLGKLPLVKGMDRNHDEIIENVTIIDFKSAQGKSLQDIHTIKGTPLMDFHNELFKHIPLYSDVDIVDEVGWIDNNYRDDIRKHYLEILPLFITNAIMFESYTEAEFDFLNDVMLPTFKETEKLFGYKPLIVELIDNQLEHFRNWNAYPSTLFNFVKRESLPTGEQGQL